jgi:hypothetical protein
MKVLNCGYICRVAVIPKYMHWGMYVWRVFSLLISLCAILGNCWDEMKSSAGMLTMHRGRSNVACQVLRVFVSHVPYFKRCMSLF